MTRPIFVVSDLHLGDQGPRDNFHLGDREQQFLGFLDHVGQEQGELFLLGDVFELWQANLGTVLVRRRPLLDRLASLGAVYVVGNHDVDLQAFAGTDLLAHPFFRTLQGPFERTLGGKRFRFMHGNETDPFNRGEVPGSGRMLTILAGMVEDWKGSPMSTADRTVEETLELAGEHLLSAAQLSLRLMRGRLGLDSTPDVGKGLTPTQHPSRLDDHLDGVREDRRKRGYDVAVVGHTHVPGTVGDWYVNSGSWTRKTNDYLRVGPDGTVAYFQWSGGPRGFSMPIAYGGRYR